MSDTLLACRSRAKYSTSREREPNVRYALLACRGRTKHSTRQEREPNVRYALACRSLAQRAT
jgi:hypothetical protein